MQRSPKRYRYLAALLILTWVVAPAAEAQRTDISILASQRERDRLGTLEEQILAQHSAIMDTALRSGDTPAIAAIAAKYDVDEWTAGKLFDQSMEFFVESAREQEIIGDRAQLAELVTDSGATVVALVGGLLGGGVTAIAFVGGGVAATGMMATGTAVLLGIGAFSLKAAALAEQWDAYLDGRQPDADVVGKLNQGSTALGIGAMGSGYTQGLSGTASEDAANLIGTLLNGDVQAAAAKVYKLLAEKKVDPCDAYVGTWEWVNGGTMTFADGQTWVWKRGAGVALETEFNMGTWECRDDAAGVVFYEANYGDYPGCLIMSEGVIHATDCTAHGVGNFIGTRHQE